MPLPMCGLSRGKFVSQWMGQVLHSGHLTETDKCMIKCLSVSDFPVNTYYNFKSLNVESSIHITDKLGFEGYLVSKLVVLCCWLYMYFSVLFVMQLFRHCAYGLFCCITNYMLIISICVYACMFVCGWMSMGNEGFCFSSSSLS